MASQNQLRNRRYHESLLTLPARQVAALLESKPAFRFQDFVGWELLLTSLRRERSMPPGALRPQGHHILGRPGSSPRSAA